MPPRQPRFREPQWSAAFRVRRVPPGNRRWLREDCREPRLPSDPERCSRESRGTPLPAFRSHPAPASQEASSLDLIGVEAQTATSHASGTDRYTWPHLIQSLHAQVHFHSGDCRCRHCCPPPRSIKRTWNTPVPAASRCCSTSTFPMARDRSPPPSSIHGGGFDEGSKSTNVQPLVRRRWPTPDSRGSASITAWRRSSDFPQAIEDVDERHPLGEGQRRRSTTWMLRRSC